MAVIWVMALGSAAAMEERNQCDLDLRESRELIDLNAELLSGIVNNTSAVIYVKDLEGKYILMNKQYEQLFSLRKDQAKGKTDFDIFPKEIAENFPANDQKVLESGEIME